MPSGEEAPPGGGSAEVDVRMRADGPASAPWKVLVDLHWRAADPLSVDLNVCADPPHPALPSGHWVILRDVLCHGLDAPTGDGRVRLWPEPAWDRLHLHLTIPRAGDVWLSVPAGTVRGFLDQTLLVVPYGKELPSTLLDDLANRLRRS